ncbi:serine/threonine-protein kinase [Rhizohabitans arisaemae]|uniref:serine/threonine-protein kinase n=1 Tax=Rhizohabitans arisaemae TaxID=2720610 RepID=UPI0024B1BF42|nr:serine/threonine-protein kinase [Rhizohabitans arisaemae]
MSHFEPLTPGDPRRIGPYLIMGKLGEGGQGLVYLAQAPGGERVAVKVLRAGWASETDARRRFTEELAAARRVRHAYTAAVLDADVDGHVPYIVSEYVQGPSLQRAVDERGPYTGPALERLTISLATALATIHDARVIHRDFKPGNVLIGPDGPRVVDFGIARAVETTLGPTTRLLGTPLYMAPEQFEVGSVGTAADVYAWAATVVFSATGRTLFGSVPLNALPHHILNTAPDLSGVPAALRPVVERCLSKDPALRPTAFHLLQALVSPDPTPERLRTAPPARPTPTLVLPDGLHPEATPPERNPSARIPPARPPVPAGPVPVPAPGGDETPPLHLTVGRTRHLLTGNDPHTVGGPGCTIEAGGTGILLYIRYRGAWRVNIRMPGAMVEAVNAQLTGFMVHLDRPGARCTVRGEAGGTHLEFRLSLDPAD